MYPVLLKTPYFTIYSYGFCMALAVLLAWFISSKLSQHFSNRQTGSPYSASTATDLLFVFFASGIAGARLFYVLQHPGEYAGRWQAVLFLQEGGLVWYGGFLGGVACGLLYMKQRRIPILVWADLFAPVLALSHAVGRVGCYLNGCCYGRDGYPVQIYEAVLLCTISALLFVRLFRQKKEGEIFALYLIAYGLLRFGLEFFRGDQTAYAGLTLPQWISLCVFIFGVRLYGNIRRPHR